MDLPRRVLLEFDSRQAIDQEAPVRLDLSVAVRTGNDLWVASDESTALERLTLTGPDRLASHRRFALADYLHLPSGEDEEIDIEGLGFDGTYLWVVGSHSLKRKKPKARLEKAEQVARLAEVKREANRYLLARIPCLRTDGNSHELHRSVDSPAVLPMRGKTRLVASQLRAKGDGNELTHAIAEDEHLGPFLDIPGKDNGFDIEGLGTADGRVYLGLRGPVLRGFAVVLSLEVEQDDDDEHELRLVKRAVGRDTDGKRVRRSYAKHFLDLRGMGIRELRPQGRDLLVLAGPTMALDGTIAVFRWVGGGESDSDEVVHADRLPRLFDVPHGPSENRAEGMTLWGEGDAGDELLVVYDGPDEARKQGPAGVYADLFLLPGALIA